MPKKIKTVNPVFDEVTMDKNKEALIVSPRIQSDQDAELIEKIYNRFSVMERHRRTSCPFGVPVVSHKVHDTDREIGNQDQYETEVSNSRLNWETAWKRARDLWMMKPGTNRFDKDLPDVSSPLTWASANAVISQYQDSDTSVFFEPGIGADKVISKIAAAYIDHLEVNANVRKVKTTVLFPEAVICGTAISHNAYITKKRTVKRLKTIDELMGEYDDNEESTTESEAEFETTTDENGKPVTNVTASVQTEMPDQKKQALMDKIKSNPWKYLVEEDEVVDFDDVTMEHVPLEEMFIDPGALDFNTVSRGARDCIWRQWKTVQEVFSEYENSDDPFVIKSNLTADLIQASGQVTDFYTELNLQPELTKLMSLGDNVDLVCVVKYYNKETDQFIVIANDIVIRNGPLPYNHKQLPFSKYVLIPLPRHFYGIGFGTLLDPSQTLDEEFKALAAYRAEYDTNQPKIAVGDTLQESLRTIMEEDRRLKAGTIIEADSGDSIIPMPVSAVPFDIDKMRTDSSNTATLITSINPVMATMPSQGMAVRSIQMGQENGLQRTRTYVQTFEYGYLDFVLQALSIAKQIEPNNYETIQDETEEAYSNAQVTAQLKQYKTIKVPGIQFKNNVMSEENMTESVDGTITQLSPDITDKFDSVKVTVRVETNQLASRQLQSQQLQETINLVMAIRANPATKDDKIVNALLKDYLDKRNTDPKILAMFQDDDSDESDQLADIQNDVMSQGIKIEPIAGMSESHLMKHTAYSHKLLLELYQIDQEVEKMMPQLEQMMADPMMASQVQPIVEQSKMKRDNIVKTIDLVNQHILGDMQAKTDEVAATVKMNQSALQPPMSATQPQAPGMPMQGQSDPNQPPVDPSQGQEMPINPMPQQGQA